MRRPRRVTLLVMVVLIFTGLNLIRFYQAIKLWNFLSSLPIVSPLYLAATGFVWSLSGLILAGWLWTGKRIAPPAAISGGIAYTLYFWLDRAFVAKDPIGQADLSAWPFHLGANLILLVFLFGILSSRKVRRYYGNIDVR